MCFVGGNLVTWRSKKQHVVSRPSAESEHRAMAQTACELLLVESLLKDLGVQVKRYISMYCDNKAATFLANNPVFHERTKHIAIDYYFIRDAILHGQISTPHLTIENQLVNIFTKAL